MHPDKTRHMKSHTGSTQNSVDLLVRKTNMIVLQTVLFTRSLSFDFNTPRASPVYGGPNSAITSVDIITPSKDRHVLGTAMIRQLHLFTNHLLDQMPSSSFKVANKIVRYLSAPG